MPSTRGLAAENPSRVEALRAKHAQISEQLEQEQLHPSVSDFYLKQLKKGLFHLTVSV